ncbi:MAG: bifunctional folylpolyglutamate synthase/dihydrofolate synthase [Lachnospiraceae bacterium]|nr:bifunctional folylpolyglutamate synthase/dihydrofolate synthase [Lachnospiraceae bacterium]
MKKQAITTYQEAVDYLYEIPRFTAKHALEDTKAHLVRLGSPDQTVRNIIHVAGTNGKGSVCTYLRYCLEEAGYRVAVFTSPHLVDIRERFVVDGHMIGEEDFLRLFLQVYDSLDWTCAEQYHPTYFEYLFLMAMLYFAEVQPDYCILETGLGGRLDATNAVAEKALTIITRIGLDHTEYLGDTLAQIAWEKAGIMRQGVPVVYCDAVPEASAVFVERAKKLQIESYPVSKKDYAFSKFENKSIDFSLHTRYYGYIGVTLRTMARYQMENAAIAVRGLEVLSDAAAVAAGQEPMCMAERKPVRTAEQKPLCTAEQIRTGLRKAFWQGRMEEILPEVFVDGAHNADGIRAFLDTVKADGCTESGRKRTLIFSVVQDKDYKSMIRQVLAAEVFDRIYVAHMQSKRAADPEQIRLAWEQGETKVQIVICEDVREALRRAVAVQEGDRIYVAGSLYLVGEIKEFLEHDQF